MHESEHGIKFVEQEHARLESELADLRRRREQLHSELQADAESVGDRGDAADALQRAEDLGGLDEQIGRLTWLLAGGNATVEGQLPNGTQVKLRWADGESPPCGWSTSSRRPGRRRTPR